MPENKGSGPLSVVVYYHGSGWGIASNVLTYPVAGVEMDTQSYKDNASANR